MTGMREETGSGAGTDTGRTADHHAGAAGTGGPAGTGAVPGPTGTGAVAGPAGTGAVAGAEAGVRWAYAACAWLAVSTVWHVWMGIDYRAAMGSEDDIPVWGFLLYDGLITAMSAIGVVCVLATIRPWGRRLPLWMVRIPLTIGSVLLLVRGLPGLVENITTASGLTPHGLLGQGDELADLGTRAFWEGMAINTYFFLGAVALIPATLAWRRRLAAESGPGAERRGGAGAGAGIGPSGGEEAGAGAGTLT
ncbi:hypothetical protein ACZ90_49160 [Streptomyces albus subsp. albus]|nr:hypothetical protein ACZ90_49160 [Streptomyces albus subsp. albus]